VLTGLEFTAHPAERGCAARGSFANKKKRGGEGKKKKLGKRQPGEKGMEGSGKCLKKLEEGGEYLGLFFLVCPYFEGV